MTGYAPGQTYRLPLTFADVGPDAAPTVQVYRNFEAVAPAVTVSGSGLQWGVALVVPAWDPFDTVQVVVRWTLGGEAGVTDGVFLVGGECPPAIPPGLSWAEGVNLRLDCIEAVVGGRPAGG